MNKIESFKGDEFYLQGASIYETETIDTPLKSAIFCELAYRPPEEVKSEFCGDHLQIDFFDVDDIQYYILKNGRSIMFLFRGTDSLKDIKRHVNTLLVNTEYGKIHAGFLESWKTIKTNVMENAEKYELVKCYGHSYGGALAMIAGLFIAGELKKRVHCYTFGCPRVGDYKFAKNFNKFIGIHRRYVCYSDPIIRVPSILRFTHAGLKINLDPRPVHIRAFRRILRCLRGDVFHSHSMINYVKLCSKFNIMQN